VAATDGSGASYASRVSIERAQAPAAWLHGLTSAEVADRVANGRTNAYRPSTGRSYRDIFRDNLITPFNITLTVLLVVLLALGQLGDTLFAASAVVINTVAGLIQEIRAKRQIEYLARVAAGTVRVRRDGAMAEIPPDEVVLDDLVDVQPGDRVAVDGPCAFADALEVDESPISGESDAVAKSAGDQLTSGSFVIAGRGIMRAEKVGVDSFVNRLGTTAAGYKHSQTPIQRAVDAIVQISVLLMLIFGPLIFVQGYVGGVSLVDMVRNAVVLVTTFVPQGLVLATTIALSYGAIRIGLQRTLVQRINAVESMGNVTDLCFDKTGTLTLNMLTVEAIVPVDGRGEEEVRRDLALYVGNLATENRTATAIGDAVGRTPGNLAKTAELAFKSARRWGAVTFEGGTTMVLGAPDSLVADADILVRATESAARGLRVVAFGTATEAPVDGNPPAGLAPSALVVLRDQVRPDVGETLRSLAGRGINLRVISGDSMETVLAVAREAGMEVRGAITGPELETLQGEEYAEIVARTNVFARISPEEKKRIAAQLARRGAYVAMVGDGVNDVPALKEARMGIAMANGAQMAKDVSDLVLMDNALTTLPKAMEEGELTTQKIYASTRMLLSKNTYMILAVILVGFMALPFPGQVRQLSWVTIMTTGVPSLLVSLGLLRPRRVRDFTREVIGMVIVTGVLGALVLAAAYAIAYFGFGNDVNMARSALSMVALAYGVVVYWDVQGVSPFMPRSFRRRPREAAVGVLLVIVGIAGPVILPGFFQLAPMPWQLWGMILTMSVVSAYLYWRSTLARPRLIEPIRVLIHAGRD